MFTEEKLKEVPQELEKLFKELEFDVINDITKRIEAIDKISRTADYELWIATQLKTFPTDLRKKIQKALKYSDEQMNHLYEDIVEEGYAQDEALYKAVDVPFVPLEENKPIKQLVDALQEQSKDDIKNLTKTTGFVLSNGGSKVATQYFRDELNKAVVEISTGAFDYDSTMKRIVNEMANSGLRYIDYESGHTDRLDVATRRAVMTGIAQITETIAEDNAKKLDTEYFEVSAHVTARPSHALWQGKVYTKEQLVSICGLGTVTGLLGANCYHTYDPFIMGISVRRYSDDYLKDLYKKTQEKKYYKDKLYTPYEATQRQRQLERRMRVQDEKIKLLKGTDNKDALREAKARREATYQEYKQFSNTMGLPEQMNRVFNSEIKASKYDTLPSTYKNVTSEYINRDGAGTVTKDEGYLQDYQHLKDEETARWLQNNFGGNVHLKKESEEKNVKTSDVEWNGKLWEFKDVTSVNSVGDRIRNGIKQIKDNAGGFVLDFKNSKLSNSEAIEAVVQKMRNYKKYDDIDVIIKRGDDLINIVRSYGRHEKN